MDDLIAVMSALSDRNRVRAVVACLSGELCVCQIVELLALAPSTVSKHLWILRQAGLLEGRKEGRWIYYRTPAEAKPIARHALELLAAAATGDREVAEDRKRLKTILTCDPERLCLKQRTASECSSSVRATPVEPDGGRLCSPTQGRPECVEGQPRSLGRGRNSRGLP